MNKPVYIFSGFLDSGKTSAIKNTLYDGRFNEGEKTLIIVFEQGDVEYDEKFLKYTNSVVEYLDFKDFNKDKQKELDKKHEPERVVIEFNGMDDDLVLLKNGFIDNWEVAQTLTTIDASTFKNYITNMKQFMYNHVKYAEVAVINRSDGVDLRYLRNNLKGINQRLETIFEDKEGNVTNKLQEDLFDVTKPLDISDLDFGLWYMDALDNAMKYDNADIEINSFYYEKIKEYDDVYLFGRKAMVCCANDIQTIGFTVVAPENTKLTLDKYYHIKGKIHCLDDENGYKTCVIYADSLNEIPAPENQLVNFN